MISQTETASNQYGFYAVPKKLQPKKKYRQSEYEDFYEGQNEQENEFEAIQKQPVPQHQIERDFYVDEAPYPEFKPRERGLDYGVQIERGDLFDFDLEVQPLLEILVGRSVVAAINELQEEKQKVEKREKLETYQKKRNAELMVTQRLQAKSKRKQQQSQRRVLQKQIFVKNQKQIGKKIVSRRTAKKSLLGLRNEVISELQQEGYLRSDPFTDLRINFEGWLYEQVTSLIREEVKVTKEVERMVREVQGEKEDEHKRKIQKEKKRRQDILDQRQRIRKLNEQRKEKKRIKKQRIELNAQRQPNSIKFQQLLQKYTQLQGVLKSQSRSNGFTPNGTSQVHVSGGVLNYVLVMLNGQQRAGYSGEEIQEVLVKLVSESQAPVEVEFQEGHYQVIQEQIQQMNQNPGEFMSNKQQKVAALVGKVSLSLRLLELAKVNIKTELHDAVLGAVLNVVLTTTNIPKPEQEGGEEVGYVPTEKDKQREEMKKKLNLAVFDQTNLERLGTILRVRFERKQPSETSKKSDPNQPKNQPSQEEWVQIYDGQGWSRHCSEFPQQIAREGQKPAAIAVQGFERPFVYDERVLYCLRRELERLLETEGGQEVERYEEVLANLGAALRVQVPTYDAEVRMSE